MDYSSRPPLALYSAIKTDLYKGRGPPISHMTASNRTKYGTPSSTNNDDFVPSPVLYSTSPLITPFALDPSVTVDTQLCSYSAIKTEKYSGCRLPAITLTPIVPKQRQRRSLSEPPLASSKTSDNSEFSNYLSMDPYDRPPLALYSAIKTDLYNGRKPPASHMASFNPKSICSGYFSPSLHCSTSSSQGHCAFSSSGVLTPMRRVQHPEENRKRVKFKL